MKYKIENWSAYNKSLVKRGGITLWFEEGIEQHWYGAEATSRRGRPVVYSDIAIDICLTLKVVYHLPYRATEGFVASLFAWGKVDLKVPCYTQMQRRAKTLEVPLKRATEHQGSIDIVVDSTGLKIYGEGEWKVRQHGASKRRTWKKLHLGVDPLNHEIRCMKLTECQRSDDQVFEEVMAQVDVSVERFAADGAYDKKSCYEVCYKRRTRLIVPPRRDAVIQSGKRSNEALHSRDEAIRRIAALSKETGNVQEARKRWKEESDYHIRSMAENAMFRFKTICGNTLFSRRQVTQEREVAIKVNIINKFTSLGMPLSTLVA